MVFGRPFVKWFALCHRTVVLTLLSVLSVTLVYCGQTVGWIKMKLGTEVGLGPGDIVLDADLAPPKRHSTPTFRPMSVVAKRSPISASCWALVIYIGWQWRNFFISCAVERDARSVPQVRSSNPSRGPVRRVRLRKSNYVKIIPMYMIREIIPDRQQRVRRCPL